MHRRSSNTIRTDGNVARHMVRTHRDVASRSTPSKQDRRNKQRSFHCIHLGLQMPLLSDLFNHLVAQYRQADLRSPPRSWTTTTSDDKHRAHSLDRNASLE